MDADQAAGWNGGTAVILPKRENRESQGEFPGAPVMAKGGNALKHFIIVGTYTLESGSEGIYLYRFDPESGALCLSDTSGASVNPSYLAYCAANGCVYAANEMGDASALSAYRFDADAGKLIHLHTVPLQGAGMCHVSADREGRFVVAAHYNSGSAVSLALDEDGSIGMLQSEFLHQGQGVHAQRQEHAHVHSLTFSPDEKFVYAADLGTDEIKCYLTSANGTLVAYPRGDARTASGEGPRHFAFHPGGKWAYLVSELGNHVIVYDFDADTGILVQKQIIATLPPDFSGENLGADIQITRDGRFVYVSNRGHNSIAIYHIDSGDGTLIKCGDSPCYGDWPRSICLAGADRFLLIANQESGSVAVCPRDQHSGQLAAPLAYLTIPQAVCIKEICLPE